MKPRMKKAQKQSRAQWKFAVAEVYRAHTELRDERLPQLEQQYVVLPRAPAESALPRRRRAPCPPAACRRHARHDHLGDTRRLLLQHAAQNVLPVEQDRHVEQERDRAGEDDARRPRSAAPWSVIRSEVSSKGHEGEIFAAARVNSCCSRRARERCFHRVAHRSMSASDGVAPGVSASSPCERRRSQRGSRLAASPSPASSPCSPPP